MARKKVISILTPETIVDILYIRMTKLVKRQRSWDWLSKFECSYVELERYLVKRHKVTLKQITADRYFSLFKDALYSANLNYSEYELMCILLQFSDMLNAHPSEFKSV